MITCPCGKQYVGCTIRAFSVRVGEHIAGIKGGDNKNNVPRHYRKHSRDLKGSQFVIIDKYTPPVERRSYDQRGFTPENILDRPVADLFPLWTKH